jgi:hypothetical protein
MDQLEDWPSEPRLGGGVGHRRRSGAADREQRHRRNNRPDANANSPVRFDATHGGLPPLRLLLHRKADALE